MNQDSPFDRFEAIAAAREVDEFALNTEAIRIGSDLEGLRELVRHYSGSSNVLLVRAVGFPLASAPWDFDDPDAGLNDLTREFISATGTTDDGGTLSMCMTALQGLNSKDLFATRTDADRSSVAWLLLRCLDHADINVRAGALQLMAHLSDSGRLQPSLAPQMVARLKSRIAELAEAEGDELSVELADLRDFLTTP